jgi:transcriptional regulator with XRE-family HTH domain
MPLPPTERKVELIRAGVTMKQIADALGFSISHVSYVVAGQRRHAATEKAIADAIGRDVADVFPPQDSAASVA